MIIAAATQKMTDFYKGNIHDIAAFSQGMGTGKDDRRAGGVGPAHTNSFGACRGGA